MFFVVGTAQDCAMGRNRGGQPRPTTINQGRPAAAAGSGARPQATSSSGNAYNPRRELASNVSGH
jgi:hypothetical protein